MLAYLYISDIVHVHVTYLVHVAYLDKIFVCLHFRPYSIYCTICIVKSISFQTQILYMWIMFNILCQYTHTCEHQILIPKVWIAKIITKKQNKRRLLCFNINCELWTTREGVWIPVAAPTSLGKELIYTRLTIPRNGYLALAGINSLKCSSAVMAATCTCTCKYVRYKS